MLKTKNVKVNQGETRGYLVFYFGMFTGHKYCYEVSVCLCFSFYLSFLFSCVNFMFTLMFLLLFSFE